MRRTTRSPLDVLVKAFAISRKQRFDLELRSVPESIDVIVLPAPRDDRELVDFSNGDQYAARRTTSRSTALDADEEAIRRRTTLRRCWWRHTANARRSALRLAPGRVDARSSSMVPTKMRRVNARARIIRARPIASASWRTPQG